MKPKNRVYCQSCKKSKLQFESESKALNFIKFNADEILEETGKAPIRAYYCNLCCCWHVTSAPDVGQDEKIKQRDEAFLTGQEIQKDPYHLKDIALRIPSEIIFSGKSSRNKEISIWLEENTIFLPSEIIEKLKAKITMLVTYEKKHNYIFEHYPETQENCKKDLIKLLF